MSTGEIVSLKAVVVKAHTAKIIIALSIKFALKYVPGCVSLEECSLI